ncbi:3-phosphoshikimate 1-carboxyvinyltransferase [Terriglobus roseus]|uniref:3-phosphoshikimate 1-carboxyvinyltransferase n=1 Tax=Terriglobus roseus TaxID=392734 RepID=A0A1G7J7E4_9BACT|nr:3-phosphoshikimate 1-carboxyvinyltransferase [Terriglobus roseus]SDF20796.1 3-phosphoshikimate 1-carboxyvinyltransferase [Terriglobus roseus]
MSHNGTTEVVRPARTVRGSVRLPGDKSISHRYAMLAGLANGTSRFANFSTGADPHSSLSCMEALGATVVKRPDGVIEVTGVGGTFQKPTCDLDCGNSGSTMRMLAGLVAGHKGTYRFVGDASLTKRPMQRIKGPLEQMGAQVELTEGHAPMTVHGGTLTAIEFSAPIASAQVKTAVLFAGLGAEGTTTLQEAVRTRDHSEHALRAFGVELERGKDSISIRGGQQLQAIEATVPGDLSSAAFFLCATILFPDAQLVLDDVGMNPSRSTLLDVLASMGLQVKVLNLEEKHGEMIGTIQVNGAAELKGAEIVGDLPALIIDELPVLAAIGPYTSTGVTIRNAKELRVKESDRIALVVQNLRAMGAEVEEFEDGLYVPGNQKLRGGIVDSADDHRIAMAFAICALRAEGETTIHGAEAAAISFPEFFPLLNQISER